MIPRYSRPRMTAIWAPENRFRIWFEIEAHAADAMAELGVIPKAAAEAVWAKGRDKVDPARDRRDRARGQARRHRVPHQPRRACRAGGALPAPGHDLVGRARHLPRGPAQEAADILLDDLDALLAGLEAPGAASTRRRSPSAAATASTPSRPPSGSSSPATTPSSRAAARGSRRRAPRSRPAPSRARSAPSPTSIRGSRSMSRRSSASRSSRSRPRSSRATGTPCSSPRSA